LKKSKTLSFLFVPQFKDYEKKKEVTQLINRNALDISPFTENGFYKTTLSSRLLTPSDSLILIHIDDLLIGLSILKLDSLISDFEFLESTLYIQTSVLEPVFRGKGIGNLLYREIEAVNAEILKRPFILRGTWDGNDTQHHLFAKLGYTIFSTYSYKCTNYTKMSLYGKKVAMQEQIPETIIC
jgi:GNAT superfamily N-acetyltransferase